MVHAIPWIGGANIIVSAKDTRTALKRHVLPLLRDIGFSDGTPSKLWRHQNGRIEIICLSTYSNYRALTDNCTTASFTVSVGISLAEYSALNSHFHKDYIKMGPNGPRPREAQMPIRGYFCPGDAPPMKKGRWGWEYQTMWRVDTEADAEERATDLASQLKDYGLEWMTRSWDVNELERLLDLDEMNPILITSKNGSHLRLDADGKGSNIRADHIQMLRSGPREPPE